MLAALYRCGQLVSRRRSVQGDGRFLWCFGGWCFRAGALGKPGDAQTVSHGMRSMASTILNEHGWDPELIEVALAHVDKDAVRSAYNRADYIERRRPMMAWWSEHIQEAATGNLSVSVIQENRDRKVVPIR